MEQKKIIGENIKAARKLKGLSQRALAEKLGIAFQNLSVWENGKGAPSARYLLKLAEVLDISLDQITSPSGMMSALERKPERQFAGMQQFGGGTEPSRMPELVPSEMARMIQRELSDNHSLKLIIAYLEEILSLLRNSQGNRELRRVAETKGFGEYGQTQIRVPLPPADLSTEERLKWERNAATLLKWTQSEHAFWVPAWTLEKFCLEASSLSYGNNLEDVSQVLKSYLEKAKNI
jgi:transcriptional regulator with XRE-family HTH domain